MWMKSKLKVLSPTDGDDWIYGGADSDSLNGLAGNDNLYGEGVIDW